MRAQQVQFHPLSEKHALEQVVRELSRHEPADAIGAAGPWIDSLVGSPDLGPNECARLLFALDEASQAPARNCVELYLAARHKSASERKRLWALTHGFWSMVLEAYADLLIMHAAEREPSARSFLAQLAVRAIRAGAQRAKWDAFRHGPIDDVVWARLNLAYRVAARSGVERESVRLRADRDATTSVEREYLRAVALHSLGPDQLDADRLELASRLVHYVSPRLELSSRPGTTTLYWVDLGHTLPPARMMQVPQQIVQGLFFSGASATLALHELLELVSAGNVPAGLLLQHDAGNTAGLSSVLSHMIRVWSNDAPLRRYRRHPVPGRLLVAMGLQEFSLRLGSEEHGGLLRDWSMRDASTHGVGVEAPEGDVDEVQLGMLLGMHSSDGNRWRVGTVRRLWRTAKGCNQVGIELLGNEPVGAVADDGAQRVKIILLDPLRRGLPVRVILPLSARSERPLYVLGQNRTVKLLPLPEREYGLDHEIRSYLFAV
ncbi:hypothetical protein [Uliginosibacterium sp. 31-12]|uniref:hypothetical protein n=1 Tax=Uliginosibacterium sp. 31-12 TaxID=3062781 RepID=UPI0026E3E9E9|nr:hypothetical protein [Uliginosibacterium sp. 31-12]MDO6387934.1 hypothetical protein [Uliginosibacterium sp. 31-12]